jgi:hypothetical protein
MDVFLNKKTSILLKLVLSALLLLCLLKMPYGYFQFIRLISTVVFTLFAIQFNKLHSPILTITFGTLALLFQPLIKIPLGRELWNIVDVMVAIFLICSVFIHDLKKKN